MPDDLSPVAKGFEKAIPKDQSLVACQLCSERTADVIQHLRERHKGTRIDEYVLRFPKAPLLPQQAPAGSGRGRNDRRGSGEGSGEGKMPRVTQAEADEHPGGRDGALIEKLLDPSERQMFREDLEGLIAQGYPDRYQIVSAAYLMTLARRLRTKVEDLAQRSDRQVYDSDDLENLTKLESKIRETLQALEKARAQRKGEEKKDEDPLAVHERELAEAEAWVRERQGEFYDRCPNCGLMLTPIGLASCPGCGQQVPPPALPHWAYEPLRTSHGLEWPVWSAELWRLVVSRQIRLWVMAYVLRTSPEGLKRTAERKGIDWPEFLVIEAEERELRTMLDGQRDGLSPLALDVVQRQEADHADRE